MDKALLDGVKEFLIKNADEKNYVLVQGDFGAVYYMVNWWFKNNINLEYTMNTAANGSNAQDAQIYVENPKSFSSLFKDAIKMYKHIHAL